MQKVNLLQKLPESDLCCTLTDITLRISDLVRKRKAVAAFSLKSFYGLRFQFYQFYSSIAKMILLAFWSFVFFLNF